MPPITCWIWVAASRLPGPSDEDEPGRDLVAILQAKEPTSRPIRRIRVHWNARKDAHSCGRPSFGAAAGCPRGPHPQSRASQAPASLEPIAAKHQSADAIILSDYGYGTISAPLPPASIRAARERRIPIVVDSRFRMSEFPTSRRLRPISRSSKPPSGISIGSDAKLLRKSASACCADQRLQFAAGNPGPVRHDAFRTA